MNTIKRSELPAVGAALAAGFFAGLVAFNGDHYAIIVAPKAEGETEGEWGEYGTRIDGADSCFDGLANSIAMADADSQIANFMRDLRIGGFDDWYLPSRDELEICYRNLKPTATKNWCSFRDGDNASSVPVSYPYAKESPLQTSVELFQDSSVEAFDGVWHWSSTQYSADYAFCQGFDDGIQGYYGKNDALRARAVRRLLVIE
jgi:hypothetical protein